MQETELNAGVAVALSRLERAAAQRALILEAMRLVERAAQSVGDLTDPLSTVGQVQAEIGRPTPKVATDELVNVQRLLAAAGLVASDAETLCRAAVDILAVAMRASHAAQGALRMDAVQAVADANELPDRT